MAELSLDVPSLCPIGQLPRVVSARKPLGVTPRALFARRAVLLGVGATGSLAISRAAHAQPAALPGVPLAFAVAPTADDDDSPVRDTGWIDAQVAEMESLFGPLGVHPIAVSIRPLPSRFIHLETRADRDALTSQVRPKVVNVFVVGSLRDVDDPSRMRRGVHWRNLTHPAIRYVIVAAEAMPTVLAHEMGHYFGNGHSQVTDNLMSYDRTGGSVFLDPRQGRIIEAAAREAFRTGELAPSEH